MVVFVYVKKSSYKIYLKKKGTTEPYTASGSTRT